MSDNTSNQSGAADPGGEPSAEDYAELEAGLAAEPATIEHAPDDAAPDDDDEVLDDGQEERDGGDAVSRARQQAARYRTRLRDTEAERDQLRTQIEANRRAIVDWRANTLFTNPVDPALLTAGGLDIDTMLDEAGNLDMTKVDAFIHDVTARFGVARGFTPNQAQGASAESGRVAPSLADAFRS